MAARKQPYALSLLLLLLLLLALSTLPCIMSSANMTQECIGPHGISVYWGQHSEEEEGSLGKLCESRKFNYNIVILSYLLVSQANASTSPPTLHLENHCLNSSDPNPCTILEPQIKYCQELGIKVLLSLRMVQMVTEAPQTSSREDFAPDLAKYLVHNFLSGEPGGPFGAVSLNGINIENVADTRHLRWDDLVKLIHGWSVSQEKDVDISVSAPCPYDQDPFVDAAIQTGHVDYIWVEFYNNHPSCIYDGNPHKLLGAWEMWTSNVTNSWIFLGLTADHDMHLEGYIKPEVVNSQILPQVKKASNYGGVMIRNRYFDKKYDYTPQIRNSVPKICKCDCSCNKTAFPGFNSLLARY